MEASTAAPPFGDITPLEDLADEAGLDADELRDYLHAEISRRASARYAMHSRAYDALDRRIAGAVESGSLVANSGDDGYTTGTNR